MQASIKIGANTTITVDAEKPVDLIKQIAQISDLPSQCGHCGSDNLIFKNRVAGDQKQYSYLTLACRECEAAMDIGQHKTGGTVFPDLSAKDKTNAKGGWYKWREQAYAKNSQGSGSSQPAYQQEEEDDDIPF